MSIIERKRLAPAQPERSHVGAGEVSRGRGHHSTRATAETGTLSEYPNDLDVGQKVHGVAGAPGNRSGQQDVPVRAALSSGVAQSSCIH